jgi:phosphoglycerate kinase
MSSFIEVMKKSDWKAAVIRVDFNVPVENGKIVDPTRVLAAKPTIDAVAAHGARPILISHFRDPKDEDLANSDARGGFSFLHILPQISELLQRPVYLFDLFDDKLCENIGYAKAGAAVLLDNSRFWPGEKGCNSELAKKVASLGDVFVNDAFSCAHRRHASTVGIAQFLPTYPGIHFDAELKALNRAFQSAAKPMLAIVGGAKVSSKFPILENLLARVDFLAIGGAMAHTFFAYKGLKIGKSLYEPEYVERAGELLEKFGNKILLPCDVVAAQALDSPPVSITLSSDAVADDLSIFDIGPATVSSWGAIISNAKTILWNGTVGVSERSPFDKGSSGIAFAIGSNDAAYRVAGGGDTLAFINSQNFFSNFSHVCTGGGAFLEWLTGRPLPVEETFIKLSNL